MGRLSARSNPTGLRELERKRVSVAVTEMGGSRTFTVDRLDLEGTGLAHDLKVIVMARAGNTSLRYEMGTASGLIRESRSIDGLDRSKPLRFRILLHGEDEPKLAASIENLRPRDDSQSESLLPMEAADLGERLWKLLINDDGPVLQFNSAVFPSAAGAENFVPFVTLVLPEALRQVMEWIASEPGCLDDEGAPQHSWSGWLKKFRAEPPPEDGEDKEAIAAWCNQMVDDFCRHFRLASLLRAELFKESEK